MVYGPNAGPENPDIRIASSDNIRFGNVWHMYADRTGRTLRTNPSSYLY